MRTTDRGRRCRLLALVLLPLVAVSLAACGDGGADRDDAGGREAVPKVMADLDWDVSDSTVESDACGQWVVHSDFEEPLQVVDVPADEVVVPEVTPPTGSDLEPSTSWTTSGGCVDTDDGPVVVVDTQAPFLDLSKAPPKLIVGFRPDGTQLWVREVGGAYFAGYDDRGAFVLDELGPEPGGWLVLDARTGETVAEGTGDQREPTNAVAPDLAVTLTDGLVRLPSGESPVASGSVAQVDGEHLLVATGAGVELVAISDGATVWTVADADLLTLWSDAADLSTGVAVVRDDDDLMRGIDLATGQVRWTSPVPRAEVNATESDIGSGVLVVLQSGDLDQQVVIDTETGERLPDPDGHLVVGQEILLLVDEDGVPRPVTVDDLR